MVSNLGERGTGAPGVWTIVVAAGSARRFGADKLGVALRGDDTVLDMSIVQASRAGEGVVVVVRDDDPLLHAVPRTGLQVVQGGATRSESVRCGLAAVPETAEVILVHDAARPLADEALYDRVLAALRGGAQAVVPVVPMVDSIRALDGTSVDRDNLVAVQTPQGFHADVLRRAHASAVEATDDAALVEAIGVPVVLVDGDVRNLKITRPADIEVARAHLRDDS